MKSFSVSEERFRRAFDRRCPHDAGRLHIGTSGEIAGRRKGDRFYLYRRKSGFLSLAALTLYGRIEKDGVRYRFLRPWTFFIPWGLWCALLLYTGASLLFTEPDFALFFLCPGALLSLPLFLFSKRKRST